MYKYCYILPSVETCVGRYCIVGQTVTTCLDLVIKLVNMLAIKFGNLLGLLLDNMLVIILVTNCLTC